MIVHSRFSMLHGRSLAKTDRMLLRRSSLWQGTYVKSLRLDNLLVTNLHRCMMLVLRVFWCHFINIWERRVIVYWTIHWFTFSVETWLVARGTTKCRATSRCLMAGVLLRSYQPLLVKNRVRWQVLSFAISIHIPTLHVITCNIFMRNLLHIWSPLTHSNSSLQQIVFLIDVFI